MYFEFTFSRQDHLLHYFCGEPYCHEWQPWLCWDGSRWKIDGDGAVTRMASTIADQVWNLIAGCHTNAAVDFAKSTSKSSGVSAMLKLASSMLPISVDELDANHRLLNCQNGTVDRGIVKSCR